MDASHFVDPAPLQPLTKRDQGRPRLYSDEIAYELCERVGNGEKLHAICKDARMPSTTTVYRWRSEDEQFAKLYNCALGAKFELKCDELEAIAADGTDDYKLDTEADVPTVRPNKESLGRSKLRIETAWKIMAKELPKVYGEPAPVQVPAPAAAAPPDRPALTHSDNVIALIDQFGMRGTGVAVK